MAIDSKSLKTILVSQSYVSAADMKKAEIACKARRLDLVDYLLSQGLINKDLLGQAMAEFYGVPYFDLNSNRPSRKQVLALAEDVAKKFKLVIYAYNKSKQELSIATDDPKQPGLAIALKKLFPGKKIKLGLSLIEDINENLNFYQKSLETRFSKILTDQGRIAPEIINEILSDAVNYHSSDIHFEPQGEEVLVRFRIDGVLHEAGRLPRLYYENVVNRIKVQSRLRIDEHSAAQDGSWQHEVGGKKVDIRTSIVPVVDGEKIVLRLLASYVQGMSLNDLGLNVKHQSDLKEASHKPFGMIVVVGPTGSGKTTTLYAVLKSINRSGFNITTIEDPVEYKITGINQIQVNPATNLTFADGLKSIVRQDPDVILVGEIRDEETVEIALNAALTGHLLLSTFHSNDAATAVPRLLDMGAEPFLLASTLELIIAQRLVRRLCEKCRYSEVVSVSSLENVFRGAKKYFPSGKTTLYKAKGCDACGHRGYRGRTAIFEFIQIDPKIKELILKRPSTQEIWQLARKQGAVSLFEDGLEKVKLGLTTIEELLRVAEPPQL